MHGAFRTREDLKRVKGLGPKAFELCAGFLVIRDGPQPLDTTRVHPLDYDFATALIRRAHLTVESAIGGGDAVAAKLEAVVDPAEMKPSIKLIIAAIARGSRDPRYRHRRARALSLLQIGAATSPLSVGDREDFKGKRHVVHCR